MKSVYAIINLKEREEFEKEWFLPYGYASCELFCTMKDAISVYEDEYEEDEYVIEKVNSEGRCVVYWS